jgi:hypothetical protein
MILVCLLRFVSSYHREDEMAKRLGYLALVLLSAACSDSTGPDADLSGTWRFSYTDMSGPFQGGTLRCDLDAADFVITQTGFEFFGDQIGSARLRCTASGLTVVDELVGDETIENGEVSGRNVTFRLGTIAGQHNGRVSGSSISGTARWVLTSGNLSVTLDGEFDAERR